MHILFLNRSYHPDPEATGQYLTELAEDLAAGGDEVSVVCGRSYHRNEGWGMSPFEVRKRNGVAVHRAFNTRFSKSSFAGRLINLGTYFLCCMVALLSVRRPDVVVAETDPPLLPLIGAFFSALTGARFVFLINDLYPDVAVELGAISNPIWLRLLEASTSTGLERSDVVVTLGQDMRRKVAARGCDTNKLHVIHYWVDTEKVHPVGGANRFRTQHGLKSTDFVVMYSGNMGLSQPLEDVLRAAEMLSDESRLRFLFVGDGARRDDLIELAQNLAVSSMVDFLPYQPRENLAESLGAADLHLIPLAEPATGSIVPCKVYGIMASGTPYVAITSHRCEVARFAREYGCGTWCRPGAPAEIAGNIRELLNDPECLEAMGRRGRRAAEREFNRVDAVEKYRELFRQMI